jgi:protein SCO1/2
MKHLFWMGLLLGAGLVSATARCAAALDPAAYSYREQPGAHLPMQLSFSDSANHSVRLDALAPGRPLILVLAYYRCPGLCSIVRESLFRALGAAQLKAGRDYAVAVLSIDPTESSDDAQAAKSADLAAFGSGQADEDAWHYLTGSAPDISAIANAVGFRDQFDPKTKQFIHPAGVVFLSPGGLVSSYLLGVGYTPVAVRSAIDGARTSRIVAAAMPLLLICFHFDVGTGRYSLEILKVLRLAAILTVLTLAGLLLVLHRRERVGS